MAPFLILLIFVLLAFTSCVSTEEAEPVAEEPVEAVPEPEPAVEPVEEPEAPSEEPEVFVVTEEVYVETFENAKSIIDNLNKVISSKDYQTWLTYLTDEYIAWYSNREQLDTFSEMYRKRGIDRRILSLEDYFLYVVVVSRRNANLDEIVFTDSTHITAFTKIKGQLSVLYYLEKIDNTWKIGLKPEN